LIGAEEYNIKNDSKPPVAYFRSEGNFEFGIPDKAALKNVTATGSLGMDVPQASIDKGKGLYAIAYAFHPGERIFAFRTSFPIPAIPRSSNCPRYMRGCECCW